MGEHEAYKVPGRRPWIVGIEFLDGTFIADVDDAGVLDRWRRLSWGFDGDLVAFKAMIAARTLVLYGVDLPVTGTTPDREFLGALDDAGIISYTRKD